MIDWIIVFIYFFGTILLGCVILMGIMIIRIWHKSSNGKIVKMKEIDLASGSFALSGSLPIFMASVVHFYQESFIKVVLGTIGAVIVLLVLYFVWQKMMEGFMVNNITAYNITHSDDVN